MYASNIIDPHDILDAYVKMQTLLELGEKVAARRKSLGLKQGAVAAQAGISQETLSRFERGRIAEFGSRKLLMVLAVLGLELQFTAIQPSGSLDELRIERRDARSHISKPSGTALPDILINRSPVYKDMPDP